jgi:hypothetical protein
LKGGVGLEGHVKTFCGIRFKSSSEPSKKTVDEEINDYIKQYKLDNYIFLTPINIDSKIIKGNNYLMIPDFVEAIASFEQRKATEEEIKEINHDKEILAKCKYDSYGEYVIRKSFESDEIIFWAKDKYYNVFDLFDIHINKDFKRVLISESFDKFLPSTIYEDFINKQYYNRFMQWVADEIEKVLFDK